MEGSGPGSPGRNRPTYELFADPEKAMAAMRMGARMSVEGRGWIEIARATQIPYNTLKSWQRNRTGKRALVWHTLVEQEAASMRALPDGTPIEDLRPVRVDTEGFSSPAQLANHYSIEATRIQVELMLDGKAPRKERLDASKHIQALGGHSPISKSIVITAPIEDRKVAAALFDVLQEVRSMSAPPRQIEYKDAEIAE